MFRMFAHVFMNGPQIARVVCRLAKNTQKNKLDLPDGTFGFDIYNETIFYRT